jgi:hypothetical protein
MPPFADDNQQMLLTDSCHSETVSPFNYEEIDMTLLFRREGVTTRTKSCSSSSRSKKKEKKKTKNNRSVRFANFDDVYEIKHINDMSKDEIDSIWMSSEEKSDVRMESIQIVNMMNSHQVTFELEGVCLRGLDQHVSSYKERSKETVNRLYNLIYECQTFEDRHGVQVPDDILAKYLHFLSSRCGVEAQARGIRDMNDA